MSIAVQRVEISIKTVWRPREAECLLPFAGLFTQASGSPLLARWVADRIRGRSKDALYNVLFAASQPSRRTTDHCSTTNV
jgi:hypothetical protein